MRKTIISRYFVFDEEGEWDWRLHNDENYNLFSQPEEVEIEQPTEEHTTPPTSHIANPHEDESLSEMTPLFRSVEEIYDVTENQDNLTLFCIWRNELQRCYI